MKNITLNIYTMLQHTSLVDLYLECIFCSIELCFLAIKCVCLTIPDICNLKPLGTQRKKHFLHPSMTCDSFKLPATHRL